MAVSAIEVRIKPFQAQYLPMADLDTAKIMPPIISMYLHRPRGRSRLKRMVKCLQVCPTDDVLGNVILLVVPLHTCHRQATILSLGHEVPTPPQNNSLWKIRQRRAWNLNGRSSTPTTGIRFRFWPSRPDPSFGGMNRPWCCRSSSTHL